ncbi:MAG: hypothetical protein Phog2KO_16330 [Phototrophicaceae bacterium]
MRKIDESSFLINVLKTLSEWLTRQRGLPLVVGIAFVAVGGALEFVNVAFENQIIEMVEIIFRNFGIITALVGIALLEPMGT